MSDGSIVMNFLQSFEYFFHRPLAGKPNKYGPGVGGRIPLLPPDATIDAGSVIAVCRRAGRYCFDYGV